VRGNQRNEESENEESEKRQQRLSAAGKGGSANRRRNRHETAKRQRNVAASAEEAWRRMHGENKPAEKYRKAANRMKLKSIRHPGAKRKMKASWRRQ